MPNVVLPNSLIRLSSFLMESIGFSMYTVMLSAFDKVQHPFITKPISKVGVEGAYLSIINIRNKAMALSMGVTQVLSLCDA